MIEYRDAVKRFGAHVAVDRLSVRIARGEAVALLGPNGSGKTTTLKMAAGLIKPDGGIVLVGEPPSCPWEPAVRRVLSFLPQRVAFPDALTGREVVEFYRRLRGAPAERSTAVLRFASLNGAGERAVGTYSGGMVQRLGLAVAMLPDADVLLLDEPTASLDPDGLCAFYGLVERRQAKGYTVFFTSHQVGDVERLADHGCVRSPWFDTMTASAPCSTASVLRGENTFQWFSRARQLHPPREFRRYRGAPGTRVD